MVTQRTAVSITETAEHYLLKINASQKDRAKAISGYRWDPEAVCWVYPRTARNYDALIAEFGDDIVGNLKITRPGKPTSEPGPASAAIHQALEVRMREFIEAATSKGQSSQVQALEAALAAKESELAEIRRRTALLEKQLAGSLAARQDLSAQAEGLQKELAKKTGADPAALFERLLRETAKDASGREPKFCALADRLSLNDSLPIELVKELGRELRRVVNCDDRTTSLHELLVQARDAGLLTERGIDLAHVIRKQRNVMAHEQTDRRTHRAQVLLCFFAAAMLWPELSERH
jgi:hypothetical protein